jgi:hypothetical protein
MLSRLRSGGASSVAFVAPSLTGWLLPLYELALMTARELSRGKSGGARLYLVTPENRPLIVFGKQASDGVGRLLASLGIEFIGATRPTVRAGAVGLGGSRELAVDCVVTLPLVVGPGLAGVTTTQPDGFIPVDQHGRVEGLTDVYAAGDAVEFPVKQGGLAAQQADVVAGHVASRYGARADVAPFRPVLRGMLLTGGEPRFLRSSPAGADPSRQRRLVPALVAAHQDRRPLSRAIPLPARRSGGLHEARGGLHRPGHLALGGHSARLTLMCGHCCRHATRPQWAGPTDVWRRRGGGDATSPAARATTTQSAARITATGARR